MKEKMKNNKTLFFGLLIGILVASISVFCVMTFYYKNTSLKQNKKTTKIGSGYQDITTLESIVTGLETTTSTNATKTTYTKDGTIRYTTKGGWCYIMGYDLKMYNGQTGNRNFNIATGLPVPADSYGVYAPVTGYNGAGNITVRGYGRYVYLNSSGTLKLYTWGNLADSTLQYFSMAYPIANS